MNPPFCLPDRRLRVADVVAQVLADFYMCKWPDELDPLDESLALYFDELNDPDVNDLAKTLEGQRSSGQQPIVITFSHYLPYQELLPEKRMLFVPNLAKVSCAVFPRVNVAEGLARYRMYSLQRRC